MVPELKVVIQPVLGPPVWQPIFALFVCCLFRIFYLYVFVKNRTKKIERVHFPIFCLGGGRIRGEKFTFRKVIILASLR